ncbi:hypothetical protein OSTOST_15965 [Ostertagia ostertagi]
MVLLTFRSREDADQAVMDGGLFKGAMLDVTWHRRSGGSGENSPLSADKMLASILQSESDDEVKRIKSSINVRIFYEVSKQGRSAVTVFCIQNPLFRGGDAIFLRSVIKTTIIGCRLWS